MTETSWELPVERNAQAVSVNVFLADDHPLLRAGFTMSLTNYGIKVVGQGSTPAEAIDGFKRLKPDVLVLDIRFGRGPTGLDVAREILRAFPRAKIVFLSQFDSDSLITEAYKLGGYAFITKDADPGELATAIVKAHDGQQFFLPSIAERLAILLTRGDPSPLAVLDHREREVLIHMAHGLTNSEIAEHFGLSLKTISNTTQSIKDKLGTNRAAEITRLAVKHGLIES